VSQGEILWSGEADIAQNCHYIGHQDALKSAFTLAENLAFWCGLFGGSSIDAALVAFGLESLKDQPTHLLSAGQRRRATLAKLLTAQRPLWLLDEPATALDQRSRRRLCDVIAAHVSAGGVVVMATHDDLGLKPDQTVNLGVAA
jgi:heme exporter protein A